MFIQGVGTATPETRYTQAQCWEVLEPSPTYARLSTRARAILKKVLTGDSGIVSRHLALDDLQDAFLLDPDILHARFARHAPQIAARAADEAFRSAGIGPQDIDGVLVSTCTGYLCPGLSSYVSEILALRRDVLGLDLVGQGCGAALPNLRTAEALISSGQCKRVLSVCVEVCSAALFIDEDPGVLISACLFGDGAGAVVLGGEPENGHFRVEWLGSHSILHPEDRDLLRFEQRSGMLRNLLSVRVPSLAAKHVGALIEELLSHSELPRDEIAAWILHPGGRDILASVGQRLDLGDDQLACSAAVLREYGNISSPSVFFVLKEALKKPAPDGYWVISSFGAGFSCHAAMLQVQRIPVKHSAPADYKEHGTTTLERTAG